MSDFVALYLFCAGTAAGAAFLAACFSLWREWREQRGCRLYMAARRERLNLNRVFLATGCISLGLLALGMLSLIFDLGRPDLALKLFLQPHPTLVTLGSYALALLAMLLVGLLVIGLRRPCPQGTMRRLAIGLQVATAIVSFIVMVYAGALLGLMDSAPLFNTVWLPVLFVASALASGLALVMLAMKAAGNENLPLARALERAAIRGDVVLIGTEVLVTGAYLLSVGLFSEGYSAVLGLVMGQQAGLFIGGFLGLGMAAPLVLDIVQLRAETPPWFYLLAATGTLIGAFCLRLALVQAGMPSFGTPLLPISFV